MWRTRPEPPSQPDPTPAAEPEPEPEASAKDIRPISMFGSKEEKLARFGPVINRKDLPPRLVSVGRQTKRVEAAGRSQKARIIEVEGYVDMNDPQNTYVREPGSTVIQPTMIRSGGESEVLDRFTVPGKRANQPSDRHPAGQPNKIVEPPEVSEQELALARALFAKPTGPSDPPPRPAFDPCPW